MNRIPPHFAPVFPATDHDILTIFGSESTPQRRYFALGTPLDMQTPLCVDLNKVTERSTGIFGKTGTGKTFITRLMLAGIIGKDAAVCLIFDMHNEYGAQARSEHQDTPFVKGLKTLFPQRVAIFSLDPRATQRRGIAPDRCIQFTYQSVRVEDLLSLQEELNLHTTACEAATLLAARYQRDWLATLLNQDVNLKELAHQIGAHPESIAALYRKLKIIEQLPFFQTGSEASSRHDIIDEMMDYIDRGISIIIEFGHFTSTFCYLLISNIITRHIHARYTAKTERFLESHHKQDEPKKLIIVIEEAHKFLHPAAARQTTFGVIAREMRKYYVSLLIVDQRPSGIDSEIISQIGTKIIAQLHDEQDINAVVSGSHNSAYLKTILSALGSRQQALVFGHAIAMPMMIETRSYDEAFYRAILSEKSLARSISIADIYAAPPLKDHQCP
jgi:DNA helicase HerA-like ATPase